MLQPHSGNLLGSLSLEQPKPSRCPLKLDAESSAGRQQGAGGAAACGLTDTLGVLRSGNGEFTAVLHNVQLRKRGWAPAGAGSCWIQGTQRGKTSVPH